MRKWKEELLDQRRRMMEEKLLHAEFKREVQLQAIVKKAQEEEAKVGSLGRKLLLIFVGCLAWFCIATCLNAYKIPMAVNTGQTYDHQ